MSPVETAGDPMVAHPPVDLRDPVLAAVLAWLIPGAGHWYQGRRTKAVLFFVCILGSFFYGLWLGGGRVVYAAWGPSPEDKRLPFFCQIGVGGPSLPALWQAQRFTNPRYVDMVKSRQDNKEATFGDWFMAPPIVLYDRAGKVAYNELDDLNLKYHRYFELGTVYTMIAGLLNLLVIFDACAGPAFGFGGNRSAKSDVPSKADKESKPATAPPSAG